jgi:hypothetical protein
MRYRVAQASAANARAMAVGGQVREHYEASTADLDGQAPLLSRQCVIIVTPGIVETPVAASGRPGPEGPSL